MSVAISESRPAGRGRFASALASRDLRTLILAFIVDGSSFWAYTIVLTAYVFERTPRRPSRSDQPDARRRAGRVLIRATSMDLANGLAASIQAFFG